MDANATGEKSANSCLVHKEDRNTWIFTAYVICGIAFFGVLAYFASVYFAR
jgi:hypothetical protein